MGDVEYELVFSKTKDGWPLTRPLITEAERRKSEEPCIKAMLEEIIYSLDTAKLILQQSVMPILIQEIDLNPRKIFSCCT